jgi:hypothetical protein
MVMPIQGTLRNESSTHSGNSAYKGAEENLEEAEQNLVKCLDAYRRGGDKALQAELERIHPDPTSTGLRTEKFMTNSRTRLVRRKA